jgi:hypothetical protein
MTRGEMYASLTLLACGGFVLASMVHAYMWAAFMPVLAALH